VVAYLVRCAWVDHQLTACRWPCRFTYCSQTMMARGEGSLQVVESHWVIALYSLILGYNVDSELPIGSRCIISFCISTI
jgi:hypothetical protein